MAKNKKQWIVTHKLSINSNLELFLSVQTMYASGPHYTNTKDHALIFKTKCLAKEYLKCHKQSDTLNKVIGVSDINIKINKEVHLLFKKQKEENIQREIVRQKILNDKRLIWDQDQALEKERLLHLHCPVCKQEDKEHVIKSTSNGILGSGRHSKIIDNYYICLNCGVHYTDVKKPNLGERP